MSDLKNFDMTPLYKVDNVILAWEFLQNVLTDYFNKDVLLSKRLKETLRRWLTVSIKNQMNRRESFRSPKIKSNEKTIRVEEKMYDFIRKARQQY